MSSSSNGRSTGIVVVAVLLLAIVAIPALAIVVNVASAVGVGAVLFVIAAIAFFIWLRTRLVGDE